MIFSALKSPVMTITQPSLGDFGDDLTLDHDVETEESTHEATLEVHCDPVHVSDADGWARALNMAGVFCHDMVIVAEDGPVTTLRLHYGLTVGDEVHPAAEWTQRLRLSSVPAFEVVVVSDRKVKRNARYALADKVDDVEEPLDELDYGETDEP